MRCQVDAVLGGEAVHAEGQKDVGDSSLFGSSEIARADADDFEGLVADVERAAEDVGIAAEAVIPVVPGEDRIGTGTGAAVIGGGEQAAERGLKAEEREHVAGDINDVGLLHVVVGGPGDVRAVGVADGDEVGLVLDGIAHELEVRRGPVAVLDRLAVEADHLAGEDVELAGIGDGQRAPEQGVDKTEGGDTGADAEGERKHSGRGRDLVAAELPPAETYIGEKRLKPSGSANAVARLALAQYRTEGAACFVGVASRGNGFFNVRLQLFLDLAIQALAAHGIRDTRPQRHVMPPGEPD